MSKIRKCAMVSIFISLLLWVGSAYGQPKAYTIRVEEDQFHIVLVTKGYSVTYLKSEIIPNLPYYRKGLPLQMTQIFRPNTKEDSRELMKTLFGEDTGTAPTKIVLYYPDDGNRNSARVAGFDRYGKLIITFHMWSPMEFRLLHPAIKNAFERADRADKASGGW